MPQIFTTFCNQPAYTTPRVGGTDDPTYDVNVNSVNGTLNMLVYQYGECLNFYTLHVYVWIKKQKKMKMIKCVVNFNILIYVSHLNARGPKIY